MPQKSCGRLRKSKWKLAVLHARLGAMTAAKPVASTSITKVDIDQRWRSRLEFVFISSWRYRTRRERRDGSSASGPIGLALRIAPNVVPAFPGMGSLLIIRIVQSLWFSLASGVFL